MGNTITTEFQKKTISIGGKLGEDPGPISLNKIVMVEGKDEVYFLDALLSSLNIKDVEVRDVGGKNQFKNKLPALIKLRGFRKNVEVLAVIRDADEDANAAFESIRNIFIRDLRNQDLEPPSQMNQFSEGEPRIGIFIVPNNSDPGMLEDLCLKTVETHPAMKCVKDFSDCVSKLEESPNNMAKAKAQTFLAAMPKIVSCVGRGAQRGYWEFDSNELDDLKSFLGSL